MGGAYSAHGSDKKCILFFFRKSCCEQHSENLGYGWEDNIKMDVIGIEWEVVSGSGQGPVAGSFVHGFSKTRRIS